MTTQLGLFQAPALALRDYQRECLDAIASYHQEGGRRALVALPTGTGKTVLFAQFPKLFPSGRVLVLAHREELLDQAVGKLRDADASLSIGVEQADRRAPLGAQVVVASVQTLAVSPARLMALKHDEFSAIVVDEAHHVLAKSYLDILAHFRLAPDISRLPWSETSKKFSEAVERHFEDFIPSSDAPFLAGFTATPSRTDGRGLQWVFDTIVFSRSIREMMETGWLCSMRGLQIRTGTDITDVRPYMGDYAEGALSKAVNTPERNRLVVKSYLDYAPGRQALVFAVDVQHTVDLLAEFRAAGVQADMVAGATDRGQRSATVRSYRDGRVQVLVNCMVLTEGFDAPETSCVVMARPTKSSLLYTQMVGRGSRIAPGKKDLLVLDLVDIARQAGVQTVNTLMGLPPKLRLDGVTDALGALKFMDTHQAPLDLLGEASSLEDVARVVREIDPLQAAALPPWVEEMSKLAWARTPSGYVLGIMGKGQLGITDYTLYDQATHAEVLSHAKVSFQPLNGRPLVLGDFNRLSEAFEAADAWVRGEAPQLVGLVDRQARWRTADVPATERQKLTLHNLQVEYPATLTKGQASTLIDRALAVQGGLPATNGQKWRLRQLGIRPKQGLTVAEARMLLDEAKGGQG